MKLALLLLLLPCAAWAVDITPEQERLIGRRIWINEGRGQVAFLTHWNVGEDFASMGIGHSIWYPAGRTGRFVESFPKLRAYLQAAQRPLPAWAQGACPWNTHDEFFADFQGPKLTQLRQLLSEPEMVSLQTRFIIERLAQALPAMLDAAPATERAALEAKFRQILAAPVGAYALIDYVNFKGEGTSADERYPDENGQGWGMLQALELMDAAAGQRPSEAFADGALRALQRRVDNCPTPGSPAVKKILEKGNKPPNCEQEKKWLPGWSKRLDTYRVGSLEELVP